MWTTCAKGHDLTVEGAYLYAKDGTRSCRECAIVRKKKERGVIGSFDRD